MDRSFGGADVDSVNGSAVVKVHPRFTAKLAVLAALSAVWGGPAFADPDQDNVAEISELSRRVEELSATIINAQPDLDHKMQLLSEVDRQHTDDLARLEETKAQLATFQGAVGKFAASVYMGGRTDGASAILTASSPTNLIDTLAVQRVIAIELSEQVQMLRRANEEAQNAETASAKSEADAKTAVDAAVAVRADLGKKRAELREQMAVLSRSYAMLPPDQQTGLALPSESVMAALGPVAPIPTVGMSGLVPNARTLADYIMLTYPGVQSIGGVRADALPDHPSGHALDIMIGSDMGLGDTINADLQRQAARFGISYTMWRVAAHFDHVHATVF